MIQNDNDDFTIISINEDIKIFLTLKMNMSWIPFVYVIVL